MQVSLRKLGQLRGRVHKEEAAQVRAPALLEQLVRFLSSTLRSKQPAQEKECQDRGLPALGAMTQRTRQNRDLVRGAVPRYHTLSSKAS